MKGPLDKEDLEHETWGSASARAVSAGKAPSGLAFEGPLRAFESVILPF